MKHNNTIVSQLRKLNAIEPDCGFMMRSRATFVPQMATPSIMPVAIPRNRVWLFSIAGACAALLLTIVISSSVSRPQTVFASSLDQTSITNELDGLSINIQLEQITYEREVNKTIVSAIEEISDTETNHLSPRVLEVEQENFPAVETTNPQIDKLLLELSS